MMIRIWLPIALTGCEQIFPLEFDEPTPTSNCSNTESVVDDFEGELGAHWRTTFLAPSNASTFAYDRRLEIRLAGNFNANALETAAFYDFVGRSFSVEVFGTGDLGPGSSNLFELQLGLPGFASNVSSGEFVSTGDALAIRAIQDRLELGRYQAGTFAPLRTIQPYDPTVPQRWQIEERDGLAIWSLDDGSGLVPLQSLPVGVGVVRPRVVAFQSPSGAFTTIVDNINIGVQPRSICGARVFQDEFDGSQLDPERWPERQDMGCQFVANGNGALIAEKIAGLDNANCFIRSSIPLDLHDTGLTITPGTIALTNGVAGLKATAMVELRLPPELDGNDYSARAGFQIDAFGMLSAIGTLSPNPYISIPYEPAVHAYLRLRAEEDPVTQGDQLLWETSRDGVTFDPPLFQSADYKRLDQARLVIGLTGDQNDFGTVELLGVNVR